MIAIIDYGMGNLFSVAHACKTVGLNAIITADKKQIMSADALIFPGMGAFGDAMDNLKQLDLIHPIKDFVQSGKPFMGLCLGMQLLLTESEEFGTHKGLDIIEGSVKRFQTKEEKVPQIGWNHIQQPITRSWDETPFSSVKNNEFMYFVHSYYITPTDEHVVLSYTSYAGTLYCSSVLKNNIFATQFHPEKSASEGLKIYRDWAMLFKL